jgi:hypothetical protein
MNAKIERVNKDIEKSKGKIAAEQTRLRDLEKQKTELENLDIVSTVRGMNISFTDLAALLKQANANSPGLSATSSQVGPKLDKLAASAETAPTGQNDDDKEDNE